MPTEPIIHDIFEPKTCTWQYVIADPLTSAAVVIDSVLDFEPSNTTISTESADALLALIDRKGYHVDKILETHVHADHLTAANYMQHKLMQIQGTKPNICIGKRVTEAQEKFADRYGVAEDEIENAFDKLFDDNEVFKLGELDVRVLHLPGHTHDHLGYNIGSSVFCGDSLFNADVGSARCDFPGGNSHELYSSVRKLLDLPENYRIWTGHDYPPGGEGRTEPLPCQTVAEQARSNKHLKKGVTEEDFVKWRDDRDTHLAEPRLLHWALQFNIRAGRLPAPSPSGDQLMHVPLKVAGKAW
ncbi:putative metallo-beta-lactamase domain protein [Coniochaeta ligniaria NRRL 30616]|uniref:Putative metallo-beta-lactamase domain protein n=1 Tax=Coniochaeta ligniaria NRRL 30616 TaxID=1408157 RepID=A0A1J7ILP8_9PEZI|nr:putative metallo-beta-lactamase domain protein [Coniochaeta ligniaria NRRL 30616]